VQGASEQRATECAEPLTGKRRPRLLEKRLEGAAAIAGRRERGLARAAGLHRQAEVAELTVSGRQAAQRLHVRRLQRHRGLRIRSRRLPVAESQARGGAV
jgi:hypothetical protein